MSLQAIAGIAYDRRNPDYPSAVLKQQRAEDAVKRADVLTSEQEAATQFNNALEVLKRYIPTEFLALYLPSLAIVKDRFAGDEAVVISIWMYLFLWSLLQSRFG